MKIPLESRLIDTDKLKDVDALLLEEAAKLMALYHKYNRQFAFIHDVQVREGEALSAFCLGSGEGDNAKKADQLLGRIDGFLQWFTQGKCRISQE